MGIPQSVIACSIVVLVGACTSPADGPQDSAPGPLEGKLSNNGLALNLANLDYLSTNALASSGSGSLRLDEVAHGPLLAQPGGPELLSYIVTCALDENQELQVADTTYTGNLALATQWAQGPCDESCQRWISSCVLAHTNSAGVSVTISPRGSHNGLSWTKEIEASYPKEEAAYFGNLFKPAGQRPMYACGGLGNPDNLIEAVNYFRGRVCGVGACEFEYLGPCDSLGDIGPADVFNIGVCNDYQSGYHSRCGSQSVVLQEPGETLFDEVITVYLPETP